MPSRPRRFLAGVLLSGMLFVGSAPIDIADAAPRRVDDEQWRVRQLVNQTRDNRNRGGALRMHRSFADKADAWAQQLANCQCLRHRSGPYGAPRGWYAAAENVGRGWSLFQIHRAFLNSAPHRKNILTRRFTHIGTGVARARNGEIFVVQAFMDRTP